MSGTLAKQAEITKLARALFQTPEQLGALAGLESGALSQLREMLADAVFEDAAEQLEKLVAASKLAPIPVAASIAQKVAPAKLCGALAGMIEPDRALKLIKRLAPEFMADVAAEMDPRRAHALLSQAPVKHGIDIARVLIDRGDHITLGRFAGAVPADALLAAFDVIDDETMLRVACVIEDRAAIDRLFGLVPEHRLAGLLHAAAEHGLWADLLELVGSVSPVTLATVADVAARQDDAMLNSLVRSVHADGTYPDLLPLLDAMRPDAVARFARVKALHEPDVLAALTEAAAAAGSWTATLPIARQLPVQPRKVLLGLPLFSDAAVVGQIIDAVRERDRWVDALPLIPDLPDRARQVVADVVARQPDEVIRRLVAVAVATDGWSSLLPLVPLLPEQLRERISAEAANLDKDELAAAMASASSAGQLGTMLDVAADMPEEKRESVVEVIVANAEEDDLLGAGLPQDKQQELWGKLMGLANGSPAPLLGMLGERAAAIHLDNVVPTIMSAADATGMWKAGLDMLSGADASMAEGVIASAVNVPSDLMQRAAEQAEALGIKDKLGPLGAVLDAQLAGQLTEEVRARAAAMAGDVTKTASHVVEMFTQGISGDAYSSPKDLAQDIASKLPGIGGFFGQRDKDTAKE